MLQTKISKCRRGSVDGAYQENLCSSMRAYSRTALFRVSTLMPKIPTTVFGKLAGKQGTNFQSPRLKKYLPSQWGHCEVAKRSYLIFAKSSFIM